MNLEKYIGVVPEGKHPGRVTEVKAVKTKKQDDMITFKVHFVDLDVNQTLYYPLLPTTTYRLRNDLEHAEVLREGDAYSDNMDEFASELQDDLSDRFLIFDVSPVQGSNFPEIKIEGVDVSR